MKRKKVYLILFVLSLGILFLRIPVKKVTFGMAYGECTDSCAIIYTVSQYRITKDVYDNVFDIDARSAKHTYIEEDHDGSFNNCKPWVPLLMVLIPNGFDTGCPDCWDQGSVVFKYEAFGKEKSYRMDPSKVPFYFFNLKEVLYSHANACEEKIKSFKGQ